MLRVHDRPSVSFISVYRVRHSMDWLSPFFDDEGKRRPKTDPIFSTALQEMTLWINQMDIAKLRALRILFSSEVSGTRSQFLSGLQATLSICLLSNMNEGEICINDQLTDLYNRLTPDVNGWMTEERCISNIMVSSFCVLCDATWLVRALCRSKIAIYPM